MFLDFKKFKRWLNIKINAVALRPSSSKRSLLVILRRIANVLICGFAMLLIEINIRALQVVRDASRHQGAGR